jgi:Mg2+/citrate symporter
MTFDSIPSHIWTQCLPAFLLGVVATFLWGTVLAARDRKREVTRNSDQARKHQNHRREGN